MAREPGSEFLAPPGAAAPPASHGPSRSLPPWTQQLDSLPKDLFDGRLWASPEKVPGAAELGPDQIKQIKTIGRLATDLGQGAIGRLPQLPQAPSVETIRARYSETGSLVASRAYFEYLGDTRQRLIAEGLDWPERHGDIVCRDFGRRRVSLGGKNAPKGHSSARDPANALRAQRYFERLGRRTSRGGPEPTDVVAVLGNLGPSPGQRCQFWSDVVLLERPSRGTLLTADPTVNPDFWQAALARPDCPPELDGLRGQRTGLRLPLADERIKEILAWCGLIGFPCTLKTRAPAKRSILMTNAAGERVASPICRSVGRGGTIAHKFRASLPHQLPRETCVAIARDFASYFERRDLPVCVVVHAPPAQGDERHIHLHGIVYPRPGKLLPDGSWDLQLKAAMLGVEPTYPVYLRPKDRELARPDFTVTIWSHYVDLVNTAFEKAGLAERWIASSFAEAGLEQAPRLSLDSQSFHAEKRGIITAGGRAAAAQFIDFRLAHLGERRSRDYQAARSVIHGLELWKAPKHHPAVRPIRRFAAEYLRLTRWWGAYQRCGALLRLYEASLHPARLRATFVKRELARKDLTEEKRQDLWRDALLIDPEDVAVARSCTATEAALESPMEYSPAVRQRQDRILGALKAAGSIGGLLETMVGVLARKKMPAAASSPSETLLAFKTLLEETTAEVRALVVARSSSSPPPSPSRAAAPAPGSGQGVVPHPYETAAPRADRRPIESRAVPETSRPPVSEVPSRPGDIAGEAPKATNPPAAAADHVRAGAVSSATDKGTTAGLPQQGGKAEPLPHRQLAEEGAAAGRAVARDEDVPTAGHKPLPTANPDRAVGPQQGPIPKAGASEREAWLPKPPPGAASSRPGITPLDEVFELVRDAETAAQGYLERGHPAVWRLRAAAHWVGSRYSRYVGEVAETVVSSWRLHTVGAIILYWAKLQGPARLPTPRPVSHRELDELLILLVSRHAAKEKFALRRDENRAADLAYRLAHNPDILLDQGYLKGAAPRMAGRACDRAHQANFMLARTPMDAALLFGWPSCAEAGEHRAMTRAIDNHVARLARQSGFEPDAQEMYARLIWQKEFERFLEQDHLFHAIKAEAFGPGKKEQAEAEAFFRRTPNAATILAHSNPELLQSITGFDPGTLSAALRIQGTAPPNLGR